MKAQNYGSNIVKDDFQTMLLNMPSPTTSLPCVTCPKGIDCKLFKTCDSLKGWREDEQTKMEKALREKLRHTPIIYTDYEEHKKIQEERDW
jgi:hypothetical protein